MADPLTNVKWIKTDRPAALRAYDVFDTPGEEDFDDLARVASGICGTPLQSSILLIRPASSSRPRSVSASDRHQLSLRSAPTLCSKAQSNKRTVFDDEDDHFTIFHSQVSLTRVDALLYSSSSRRKPIHSKPTPPELSQK